MKKIALLLLVCTSAFGQNVDYNKIILPDYTKSPDFAERLVQLAWKNHPTNDGYRRDVNIAEVDVRGMTVDWLNIVRVTTNMNEFTLNPEADIFGRAAFYPRYNISASISLGQLFTIPYNTRKSKLNLMKAEANLNAQKLAVRNAVLKAYNEYVLHEKIYKVQSQVMLDNETSHKLTEQRFKNGDVTFDVYSESLSNFSSITISSLEAERNYKNAKLDLEQLIGMRLEDVR